MKPETVYSRAFEAEFLRLRAAGCSEDFAVDLADRYASLKVDQYCDQKLHLKREGG